MSQPFIDTFLSEIRDKGLVKSNRFVAFIRPNGYVASRYLGYNGSSLAISQRLAVTCFSASIPSPSLLTHDANISYPTRLVPYAKSSNNQSGATFEFYCLGDMFEKEIFPKWIGGIINPETKEADFYDNYTTGSEIDLILVPNIVQSYDEIVEFISTTSSRGGKMSGFTFTEVYPYTYAYNNNAVNYQATTAPATVKVDFMFRDILPFGRLPAGRSLEIGNSDTSLFRKEIKEYSLAQAQRDFNESQRRELTSRYEKEKVAEAYNQSRNIPRGVDGKLLNPKVDGLPEENPDDRIRSALFGALSFLQQGKGFGIF